MSLIEIKRLANSHLNSVSDTIEALNDQGHEVKLTRTANDCVFVTGSISSDLINDVFYLDNEASIKRLSDFNKSIRSHIRTPQILSSNELGAA